STCRTRATTANRGHMFRIIAKSLKTGVLTEARPFDAPADFGFPVIDFTRCTACSQCASVCPTGAIQLHDDRPGRQTLSLSYGACIQCRQCVTACDEHAVTASHDADIAAHSRDQLAQAATFEVGPDGRYQFREMSLQPGAGV